MFNKEITLNNKFQIEQKSMTQNVSCDNQSS